jgi:predicted CoA-binding protein
VPTEMTAPRKRAAVAIIGASPKADRYAYRALVLLREYSYRPVPVNPAFSQILGEHCYARIGDVPEKIDTATLYLRKARSDPLIQEIISKRPRRIIMNPGAENVDLARRAEAEGIEVVQGCTLVMLRTGTF